MDIRNIPRYAIFGFFFFITSCATTLAPNITDRSTSQTSFDDFVSKTVVLPSSSPIDASVFDSSIYLQKNGKYIASTLYLLEMMPDTNLTWHYLGENAEALGLYDAAAYYYMKSDEAPWYSRFCSFEKNRTEGIAAKYCKNYAPDENVARVSSYAKNNDILWRTAQKEWENEIRLANEYIKKDLIRFQNIKEFHERMLAGEPVYRSTKSGNDWSWGDVVVGIVTIAAIAAGIEYIDSNPQQAANIFNGLSQATTSFAPTSSNSVSDRQTARKYQEVFSQYSVISLNERCTSDYSCDYGLKCIKAFGKNQGVCMQPTNTIGIKQPYEPNSQSININTNTAQQCLTNVDCPILFRCHSELKVCYK
ncbi:hypothetical protein DRW07_02080 [Alteromonas sediminis]|uniref:Lipoprotein n=1 Tax=Alteromonas sediminis TaxID=2259342 RepID=A0A3N5Y9Z2_9ALTE|nr:hypothetical protein [Alteromonas sediminis]RPJ68219.1 hypothetical protein DRW07_02080 [Alteromonas sediminis]